MGEIKSVKVDNWGVFFLQKLQNFFNKTDYCDLTLQFRDNSQLKVHRLVLSACTDYFNVLEQTCEVVDEAIIMPNGLQADVVVPIVNFMYTGTLEFELKMYNRLLRTAKDMNMTVLLKLLEAHRRTMEMHPQKTSGQASPKPRRRMNLSANASGRSLIQSNQGNKRLVTSNVGLTQNRNVSSNAVTRLPTSGPLPVRQIGSTTFTRIKVETEQQETNTPTSASGGYSLIKHSSQQPQQPTSPFEQLRKGYNNNKRPAVSTYVSPPAKKPNLEDVKEFAEQQRVRKQIAAEYGDDDYDANNIMDDDTIHNDDDDDEMMGTSGSNQTGQASVTSASAGVQTVASSSQQNQSEDPPGTTTIIVKHEGPDKPPTIVVKDSANSKMNHAKIISEVLRQYPHLIKSNKNIKLKIMPNAVGQTQKIVVKKDGMETEKQMQAPSNKLPVASKPSSDSQQQSKKILATNTVANRPKNTQSQHAEISLGGKPNSSGAQTATIKSSTGGSGASAQSTAGQPQKRRIDSKTMHALIALGAENTTGPWLCLRCGRNGHPISIPSYRGFRRHLINTHKEFIDPDLCEHCGWRSASKRELHFHMQLDHKIKTNLYIFPECQLCQQMCIDSDGLNQHLIDSHPDENKQQCIYCNKIFPEEIQLYTHMKTFHKKQALEDGIIDYSDDEHQAPLALPPLPPLEYEHEMEHEEKETQQDKKVKILSDISLPITSSIIKTDTFGNEKESATSIASEEYLQDQEHEHDNSETKFVAADGSEVILTAEQRKEILSQLNQEHEGSGIVMVLNETDQQQYGSVETQGDLGAISHDENSQATTATNDREEEDEEQAVEDEDDQHDDNQIYNEMKSLHSNLDDSRSQTEVPAEGTTEESSQHECVAENEQDNVEAARDHDERVEHLEESKESIDNLEWAENLISEHDLADEVSSSQNLKENKAEEKQDIKNDDKSQDEISKKLKELTGDWSEDDDDDDENLPEESTAEILKIKEPAKQKEETSEQADFEVDEAGLNGKSTKKQIEEPEYEDHADLLASLQNSDKDDTDKSKEKIEENLSDSENIDEDDIDMALKSLHKEDIQGTNDEDTEHRKERSNKKDSEELIVLQEKTVDDVEKTNQNQNEDDKKKLDLDATKNIDVEGEKPEEKLVKELETFAEPEVASSAMEVDEDTKKDLIDSLLSEQAETMEDTATETPSATETQKVKLESPADEEKHKNDTKKEDEPKENETKPDISENEEFLDVSRENEEALSDNVSTTIAASEPATSIEKTAVNESSSSGPKDGSTLSSEERVKSLISEWGDDEDEDDNDADLTTNL